MDFKAESQLSAVMDITSALERQNTHMNAMNDSGRMDVLPMPLVIEGMARNGKNAFLCAFKSILKISILLNLPN